MADQGRTILDIMEDDGTAIVGIKSSEHGMIWMGRADQISGGLTSEALTKWIKGASMDDCGNILLYIS